MVWHSLYKVKVLKVIVNKHLKEIYLYRCATISFKKLAHHSKLLYIHYTCHSVLYYPPF
jgi:hypothetical protein